MHHLNFNFEDLLNFFDNYVQQAPTLNTFTKLDAIIV